MSDKSVCMEIDEFQRLCRVDGRMDALISYITAQEQKKRKKGYSDFEIEDIKAIIGMCDE